MDRFSLLLVIVGAINWGLVGLFQFDLIAFLFGGQAARRGFGASPCSSPRRKPRTRRARTRTARAPERGSNENTVLPPLKRENLF